MISTKKISEILMDIAKQAMNCNDLQHIEHGPMNFVKVLYKAVTSITKQRLLSYRKLEKRFFSVTFLLLRSYKYFMNCAYKEVYT
jgi:hypothetical protein